MGQLPDLALPERDQCEFGGDEDALDRDQQQDQQAVQNDAGHR